MLKSSLFKKSIALLILVGLLELAAEIFHLHWSFWWYDVVLHALAGVFIGMIVSLLWFRDFNGSHDQKVKIIITVIISALIIGLWWEILEIYYDNTSFTDGTVYIRDTISDLIADSFGAVFGALYSFRPLSKNKNL